jgi:hypothetical protein
LESEKAMESFLNILWLLFATSAVLLWQLHWVRQKRAAQRNRVQEWTAFLCGLVLLFFAVSLTDDLHSEIVLYEECANGRRQSLVCSVAHATPSHGAKIPAAGATAILSRAASAEQFQFVAMISLAPRKLTSNVGLGLFSGRAPPLGIV